MEYRVRGGVVEFNIGDSVYVSDATAIIPKFRLQHGTVTDVSNTLYVRVHFDNIADPISAFGGGNGFKCDPQYLVHLFDEIDKRNVVSFISEF